jgi:phosphate/sulfate permease
MKTLIGGAVAAALGLVGLVIWWGQFLMVLAGIVPAMLLLGGALAIYLGFDELKDTWKDDDETVESPPESSEGEEVEKYKKEIDDLKEEIETLKKD